MDYAGDITKLRQEGASDDDLLQTYKELAPHDAADIDKLMGEGATAKDILDTVVSSPAKAPKNPQANEGILTKGLKALQYGAAKGISDYGSTAKNLGATDAGPGIEEFGKGFMPKDYKPASQDFFDPQGADKGLGGYGWGYAPRAIAESLPGLGMDLAAGVVSGGAGFVASNAARNFGPTVDERVANNGGAPATTSDKLIAGASSGISAYLNKLGMLGGAGLSGVAGAAAQGAGLKGIASIAPAMGKAALTEGVTEGAQNVVDQTAQTVGTDKGLTIDPKQIGGAAILGGATGGAARALSAPGDVANAVRQSGTDQDSNTRVADSLSALGKNNEIKDSKGQLRALDTVQAQTDAAIDASTGKAKWLVDQADAGEQLAVVRSTLKAGEELTPEQITGLKTVLDVHPDGQKLFSDLTDMATINRLRSSGTQDGDRFEGGIVGKAGKFLDPMRSGGLLLKGAGAASVFDLPMLAQIGLTGPALAKMAGLQAGAFATAKGVDKITGKANPVATFRDQFKGMKAPQAKALAERVSTVQSPTELKTEKKVKKLDNQIAEIEQNAAAEAAIETNKAENIKAKETNLGWKAYEALKAKEANPDPALADKAWKEPKLPAKAGEDAMWAAKEKLDAAEERVRLAQESNDANELAQAEAALTELSARQREIELDIKATELRAETESAAEFERGASRKAVETDKAWKAMEAAQKRQKGSPALSDRLWAPQEAKAPVDPKSVTDATKAKQENDLFSAAEPKGPSATDLENLMEKEMASARSKPLEVTVKKQAKDEPKASKESSDVDTFDVTYEDVTVSRPSDGVKNKPAYKAKTLARLKDRAAFVNEAIKVDPEAKADLAALKQQLSNSSKTWEDAQGHLADYIESRISEPGFDKLLKVWQDHEPKLKATYDR